MMRDKNNFDDQILDSLLSDAMDDLYPIDELMSSEPDDLPEPSEEFKASMNAMFKAEHKKLARKHRLKLLPRIAAAVALFIIIASITINQTSAWKEPLYNFFFHNSSDGEKTKIEIAETEEDASRYLPSYVPEGFELVENSYNENSNQYGIEYKNYNDSSYFYIIITTGDLYQDLSQYTKITYSFHDYYTNNIDTIIWRYNYYNFTISTSSNINTNELLKIANSIK